MSDSVGWRGAGWMVAAIAFTVLWPIVELLGASIGDHYHPAQIVGMRYAVHVAVLVALCGALGKRWPLVRTERLPWQLVRGACMFVMPAAFVVAITMDRANGVWAVFWAAPLLALGLGAACLHERVGFRTWSIAALGYAGVLAALEAPQAVSLAWSVPIAALMATSFAVYIVITRYLRAEPVSVSLFYTGAVACVATLPIAMLVWRPIHAADIPAIVALGCCGLAMLWLLDRLLERAAVGALAPVLFCAAIWGPLLERIGADGGGISLIAAAGIVVVLGVAAATMGRARIWRAM